MTGHNREIEPFKALDIAQNWVGLNLIVTEPHLRTCSLWVGGGLVQLSSELPISMRNKQVEELKEGGMRK